LVPLKIVSNVLKFKPAFNLNRVLADLSRGSNSLNSASDDVNLCYFKLRIFNPLDSGNPPRKFVFNEGIKKCRCDFSIPPPSLGKLNKLTWN